MKKRTRQVAKAAVLVCLIGSTTFTTGCLGMLMQLIGGLFGGLGGGCGGGGCGGGGIMSSGGGGG